MARTQVNRQAELITPLGADVLLFHHMVAQEGASRLFDYDLVVFSEDENIDLDDLIGQHAHVELELPDGETRFFCGHVTCFSFLGFHGPLAKYKIELKPWLWFLTRVINNRIFQNESVPDIIKKVCADHGFTDIDDRLSGSYDTREFCVQYRETDFAFISRLMESEGIYYYFTHESGKHELVLADSISAHETFGDYDVVPYFPPDEHDHRERDHIDAWKVSRGVRSGKIALRDYNFTTPSANMEVKAQMIRGYDHAEFEQYDYPGDYGAPGQGERYARLRLEAEQADTEVLRGGGNARGLIPGFLFELEDYPRDDQNREYLILSVTHDVLNDEYDANVTINDTNFNYSCSFMAMPSNEPFRAPRQTPRPIVHGPQTGVVVGEAGEEIWTDAHGRVKVLFHWDRLGRGDDGKGDENSSCWIRVAQGWAGKKWGMQFIPRIGHEVVVEFLEGDPDRPLVTGSVYNAENKPPYDLPGKDTHSGIKTRSSKTSGNSQFNEIRFEDSVSNELFYMQAEKDMRILVKNDKKLEVGNDYVIKVGNDRTETVEGVEDITIKKTRTINVHKKETNHFHDHRDVNVTKNYKLDVKGTWNADIKKNWIVKVKEGFVDIDIKKTLDIKALDDININTTKNTKIFSAIKTTVGDNRRWNVSGESLSVTGHSVSATGNSASATGASESVTGVSLSATGLSCSAAGIDFSAKVVTGSVERVKLGKNDIKIMKKQMELMQAEIDINFSLIMLLS